MYALAHEPITKTYTASIFSRTFCITYICYILVIIVPITLLINVGYSWPQYKRILLTPELNYKAFQSVCLTSTNAYVYDSNFDNDDISAKTYTSYVSVGRNKNQLFINGDVRTQSIRACTFSLFFQMEYEESIRSIVQVPLSFSVDDTTYQLEAAEVKGVISLESTSPFPSSSILTVDEQQVVSYGETFSMSDNFLRNGNQNITLSIKNSYEDYTYTTGTTSGFSFAGHFNIQGKIQFKESNLLDNLREFVPFFMFVGVFLWLVLVNPLVEWMLRNKIYTSKITHEKLKTQ